MSCYYNGHRDMLILRCDGCGSSTDLYKGQTDRLLKHAFIRENGWKTYKDKAGKWNDICPACKAARESEIRSRWLKKEVAE